MTAKIVKLELGPPPSVLARHLNGHHAQGPAPGGIIGRMQSESAVRAYVRQVARKYPLSDSGLHDDVWQQVEDIAALVPMLASSVAELDALAHALRGVICARRPGRLASTRGKLTSCTITLAATGDVLRLRMFDPQEVRIISVRLHPSGARRLDDRTAQT